MVVPCLVIADYPLLNTLGSRFQVNMDLSIFPSFCSQDSQFQSIQSCSGISSGDVCQKLSGVLFQNRIVAAHSLFLVRHRPVQKGFDILPGERLQFKNNGPGDQSAVYLKIRIFRGSPDKYQRTVLHKGKEIVLLSLIEPMDLINKKNGLLPIHSQIVLGFFYHFLHILFPGYCSVDLPEPGAGSIGDHFRQGGLSCSRRAVKNNAA